MRHYVDVTDADFERAIGEPKQAAEKPVQNPVQTVHATPAIGCHVRQSTLPENEKTPCLAGFSGTGDSWQVLAKSSIGGGGNRTTPENTAETHVSTLSGSKSGSLSALEAHDASLAAVVAGWPALSPEGKAAVLAIVAGENLVSDAVTKPPSTKPPHSRRKP